MSAAHTAAPEPLHRQLGLWSETEVATVADVDLRTLQTWRTQRTGPPYTKLGRKVFYFQDSVLRWLKEREEHTQP